MGFTAGSECGTAYAHPSEARGLEFVSWVNVFLIMFVHGLELFLCDLNIVSIWLHYLCNIRCRNVVMAQAVIDTAKYAMVEYPNMVSLLI